MKETVLTRAQKLSEVLNEKKAENLCVIDLSQQNGLTDFLVIATAQNGPHLDALTGYLHKSLRLKYHQTGTADSGWLVLDYGDWIVHLMTAPMRDFYKLESLWAKQATVYYI